MYRCVGHGTATRSASGGPLPTPARRVRLTFRDVTSHYGASVTYYSRVSPLTSHPGRVLTAGRRPRTSCLRLTLTDLWSAAALRLPPRCELRARPTRLASDIERSAPVRPVQLPAGQHWCHIHRTRRPACSLRLSLLPYISTPTRAVSTPIALEVNFAPSESVPRSSQAVSHTLAPLQALSVPQSRRRLVLRHPS